MWIALTWTELTEQKLFWTTGHSPGKKEWQQQKEIQQHRIWKATNHREVVSLLYVKELSQNYLYIEACSSFIDISTENRSSKSTAFFPVIYILHTQFLPMSLTAPLIYNTLPLKKFPGVSSASFPLPIHFSISSLSYISNPPLLSLWTACKEASHCWIWYQLMDSKATEGEGLVDHIGPSLLTCLL